jgi:hypothetical protein
MAVRALKERLVWLVRLIRVMMVVVAWRWQWEGLRKLVTGMVELFQDRSGFAVLGHFRLLSEGCRLAPRLRDRLEMRRDQHQRRPSVMTDGMSAAGLLEFERIAVDAMRKGAQSISVALEQTPTLAPALHDLH